MLKENFGRLTAEEEMRERSGKKTSDDQVTYGWA